MKKDEDRLVVKIAQMYYEENKTQSEISKILGIHRTSISRMLKTIKEKKIVKELNPELTTQEEIMRYSTGGVNLDGNDKF